MNKQFAETLKTFRKRKGFTQEHLAERLGKSLRYVQNLEAGKADPPLGLMIEVCRLLDADIRAFSTHKLLTNDEFCGLDSLPSPITVVDLDGHIVYCNLAYASLVEMERKRLVGQFFSHSNANKEELSGLSEYFKFLLEKKPLPTPYTTTLEAPKKGSFKVEISWNYLRDGSDKIIGFISVFRTLE